MTAEPQDRASPATGLLVGLPSVSVVLAPYDSLRFSAAWGIPAHVTLLYPFAPLDTLDGAPLARLAALFSDVPPFNVTFSRTAWFGTDVLWLAPDQSDVFASLIESILRAFPGYPPYADAAAELTPHVTIGVRTPDGSDGVSLRAMRAAERAVSRLLPLSERVDRALLMAGFPKPGSWRVVREFPFRGT